MRRDHFGKLGRRIGFLLFVLALAGCEPRADSARTSPVNVSLELGTVHPGEKTIRRRECRNEGTETIRLPYFITSCDCIRVRAEPELVKAKSTFILVTEIDLTTEPKFAGDLAIKVDGSPDATSEPVYRATLNLTIELAASAPPTQGQ